MTIFEYLSVVTSIVLSLSAAQLLTRLRSVLQPEKRYWVHALWVFFVLALHLLIWWENWGYRDVVSWNFADFTLLLLNPGILFVCSSSLVNSEANVVKHWSEHFFEVRKSIFLTLGMLTIVSVLRRWVLSDVQILNPANIPELVFALLFLAGFISRGRKVHAGLAISCWLVLLISTANTWFEPGGAVKQHEKEWIELGP